MSTTCRLGLKGTFCRECIDDTHYYVGAKADAAAQCKPCADAVSSALSDWLGLSATVVGVLGLLVAAFVWLIRRNRGLRERIDQRFQQVWHAATVKYTLPNKLKILIGYYMIVTKVCLTPCQACGRA